MQTTQPDSWEDFLTSYEAQLDALALMASSGTPVVLPEWEPPAHLGPLPEHLGSQVKDVLARSNKIAQDVASTMAAIQAELDKLPRQVQQQATAVRPTMLDEKA